mmetsp:Transcript_12125/g.36411  ORF Transcript_12125/g.36411 Transcript_12125/m.36411 type:complete len:208 (+) Transcript_12125:184-807(+)
MLTARVSAALRLGYASGHVSRGKAQGRGRHVTAAGSGYTERVLRYPDGLERRIRYPEPDRKPLQDLVIADTDGSYRSFSETEQPDRWGPPDWDVTEIWNSQDHPQNSAVASIAAPNHHHQQQQQQQHQHQQGVQQGQQMPSQVPQQMLSQAPQLMPSQVAQPLQQQPQQPRLPTRGSFRHLAGQGLVATGDDEPPEHSDQDYSGQHN